MRTAEQVRDAKRAWREKNPNYGQRWYERNRDKVIKKASAWNLANKSLRHRSWRARTLKHEYGLEIRDIEQLLASQGGRCAICSQPLIFPARDTCIDHDHETGRLRGILCRKCNSGIGFLRDSVETVRSAAAYLERNGK